MTEQEIDAMEAGRDMDAVVDVVLYPGHRVEHWHEAGRWVYYIPECDKWQGDVPRYSTEISAAWLVVEKSGLLVSHVFAARLMNTWAVYGLVLDATGAWSLDTRHPLAQADTAPLALCRAALKAADCHKITTTEADKPAEKTG